MYCQWILYDSTFNSISSAIWLISWLILKQYWFSCSLAIFMYSYYHCTSFYHSISVIGVLNYPDWRSLDEKLLSCGECTSSIGSSWCSFDSYISWLSWTVDASNFYISDDSLESLSLWLSHADPFQLSISFVSVFYEFDQLTLVDFMGQLGMDCVSKCHLLACECIEKVSIPCFFLPFLSFFFPDRGFMGATSSICHGISPMKLSSTLVLWSR